MERRHAIPARPPAGPHIAHRHGAVRRPDRLGGDRAGAAVARRARAGRCAGWLHSSPTSCVSSYLPLLWSEQLARFQLLDLTALGTWGGAVVGLLVYEAGVYFWHRTMHGSDRLWRVFHQMHHSAERLDTYGAFWFSPARHDRLDGAVEPAPDAGRRPHARGDHVVLLATTLLSDLPAQPTSAHRAGSATSCSGPKATRITTSAGVHCAQLLRSAALRSPVRHVPQPARLRGRSGLLRRCFGTDRRHAALPRRIGAALGQRG